MIGGLVHRVASLVSAVEPLKDGAEWEVLGQLEVCPEKGLWDSSLSLIPF